MFFDIPHMFYDTCLKQVAESLGVNVLILRQSFFPQQFFSMRNSYDFGHLEDRPDDAFAEPFELPPGGLELFYMKNISSSDVARGGISPRGFGQMMAHHVVKEPLKIFNPVYMYRLLKRMHRIARQFPKWRDPFFHHFHPDHLEYFEHIAQYEGQDVKLGRPFVYFPLQFQPEMTTSSLGGRYRDQILAIEHMASILPDDHLIYVKENPKQTGKLRSPWFIQRLERIEKVKIMPSHADSKTLLASSVAAANVSGTVGWEAVCAEKPVICFGAAWWAEAPGVTRFRPDLTIDEVLARRANKADLERFAGILQSRSHGGNVQRQFAEADSSITPEDNGRQVAATIMDLLRGSVPLTFDPSERPS